MGSAVFSKTENLKHSAPKVQTEFQLQKPKDKNYKWRIKQKYKVYEMNVHLSHIWIS
jgi:hypothetical protein